MSADHILRVRKLYKLILRLHRGLPEELQALGNVYTRDEFKRHKECNPAESNIFLDEWTQYAMNLSKQLKPVAQAKTKLYGKDIDPTLLDKMRDEQIVQLFELRKTTLEENEGRT